MSDVLFELDGTDSVVQVFEDRVEISRKTGWNLTRLSFAVGGKGTRTIPISTIRSVEVREMTGFVTGMLFFDTGEGTARSAPIGMLGGGTNNQILIGGVYNKKEYCEEVNAKLHQIKKYIESRVISGTAPQAALSPMDELKKLKGLLDEGIITQEEFDAKKKQLLGL